MGHARGRWAGSCVVGGVDAVCFRPRCGESKRESSSQKGVCLSQNSSLNKRSARGSSCQCHGDISHRNRRERARPGGKKHKTHSSRDPMLSIKRKHRDAAGCGNRDLLMTRPGHCGPGHAANYYGPVHSEWRAEPIGCRACSAECLTWRLTLGLYL